MNEIVKIKTGGMIKKKEVNKKGRMIYLEWRSKVKDRIRDRQNKIVRRGTEKDDKDGQTDERGEIKRKRSEKEI